MERAHLDAAGLASLEQHFDGRRVDSPGSFHFLKGGGEMGARMRALDWAETPLGPPDGWPQSLKTIVRVMLDSRYAMWMLWGEAKNFFCNDAYLPTVGIKRDWVLGARSDKVWEEIWPDIGPRIEHVLAQGEATWDEALLLYLERSGFPEETYHTFSYSPVYDDRSRVAGMLCVVTEVTERVIGERRLRVLQDLAAKANGVRSESVERTGIEACAVLSEYSLDTPFAAIYLTSAEGDSARLLASTSEQAENALPTVLPLDGSATLWPVASLYGEESVQEVGDLSSLGLDITPASWPDPLRRALLVPLKASTQGLTGFLVAACSPRRNLDDNYRAFLGLVARQIASSIADAQAYDSERRRAQALAELDRAKTAFFSNVSHEFRTPLTLMLGPLDDALLEDNLPASVRERLELAQRNAGRLQRLVNSLLDFSRIEAGRVRAKYERADLASLTRDISSSFRSAMQKAGLAFTVECSALPQAAFVDREMWEKIVLNLISNAFKFTLREVSGSVCTKKETLQGSMSWIRAPASRRRICHDCSNGSIASKAHLRERMRVQALAWRWSRNSSSCMGARSKSRACRDTGRLSRCGCPWGRVICPRRSSSWTDLRARRLRPRPSLTKPCAGFRTRPNAKRRGCFHRRCSRAGVTVDSPLPSAPGSCWPMTTPICAHTSGNCSRPTTRFMPTRTASRRWQQRVGTAPT